MHWFIAGVSVVLMLVARDDSSILAQGSSSKQRSYTKRSVSYLGRTYTKLDIPKSTYTEVPLYILFDAAAMFFCL